MGRDLDAPLIPSHSRFARSLKGRKSVPGDTRTVAKAGSVVYIKPFQGLHAATGFLTQAILAWALLAKLAEAQIPEHCLTHHNSPSHEADNEARPKCKPV